MRRPFRHYLAPVLLVVGTGAPACAQHDVRVLPVPASGMQYDPITRKIYATVGADGKGDLTNSITVIDPFAGQVVRSVFVGADPGALAISHGGQYLYVGINGGGQVRRLDTATLTPGPQYPMTGKGVRALLPLPGKPEGFIAMRGNHARYDDTLGIYVNGQLQGAEASCGPQLTVGISPARLFTYQNMLSSWDFDGFDVTPEGIVRFGHTKSLMSGNAGFHGPLNGVLITTGGAVVDPEIRQVVGRLNFGGKTGVLLPDPRTGLVYCLSEERGSHSLSASSSRNFGHQGTIPLNFGIKGGIGSPLRWGEDGIGYTAGGHVILFRLPARSTLPTVDLAVRRSPIPTTLPASGLLRYQLTVSNAGASPASSVHLSDQLPSGVEVQSVTASQGSATSADGTIRAELGGLAPGGQATVDVSLRFTEVQEVRFSAVARSFEPDANGENNIARYSAAGPISPLPDLTGAWQGLRQVAVGAGVELQAGILGRFTVRNDGKSTSPPIVLRFYLSRGPRFETRLSPLLQEMRIPALRPRQTYAAGLEALLDRGDDITGFYIFAVLDADKTARESNTSNNVVGQRVP